MNGAPARVAIFLLFCVGTVYSQTPCTVTLPVTVTVKDGTIVKHLPPESLATNTTGISLQPDFAPDDSKRRVLIVLDGSRDLQKASLEAEKYLARAIVGNARPGDSFALISRDGVPFRIQFGSDNAALLKAIDRFPKRFGKGKRIRLPDAINEGLTWFGKSEFGDSVLLLQGSIRSQQSEFPSATRAEIHFQTESCSAPYRCTYQDTTTDFGTFSPLNSSKVNRRIEPEIQKFALIAREVRLYTVQLGMFDSRPGSVSSDTGGLTFIYPEFDIQRTKTGTSAVVYPKMGGGWWKFKLNEASQNAPSAKASKIYDGIASTYRVSVRTSETHLTPISLELRPEISSKLPYAIVLYPQFIPGCTSK